MDIFKVKRFDTKPALNVTLQYNNGSPVDLTASTIYFNIGDLSTYATYRSGLCTITDSTAGQCSYNWDALDTGSVGTYWGEFEVDWGTGSLMSLPDDHSLKIQVSEDYN